MDYTARQLTLYYKEALAAEMEAQAGAIVTTNLGFAGGKAAQGAVERLRRG
ncbi:hypothetical protein AGMMS49960_06990 [Betaproteobacteria bacterium]|nr:hypothetical protein AGMMS49960_06990 [Betaproteobacteria bacterium]GHU22622.1 hypothetical protein AGMMS50243_22570 [Betaproteobacteria bacterium]